MTDSTTTPTEQDPQKPGMAPATEWEPRAISPRRRRLGRIRLALIALVVAAYVGGVWYFSSHFVPGTTVNGADAGLMTPADLERALDARVASYEQHLTSPGGYDATLKGSDVALSCDAAQVASEAMSRTIPALWPLRLLTPQHMLIDAGMSLDEERLAELVQASVSAFNEGAKQPVNAGASYDEEQKAYVATPASTGTALDVDAVTKVARIACRELREDVTLDLSALLQPTRTDTDETLLATIAQANESLSKSLDLVSDDKTVETVTPAMKHEWLSIADDLTINVDGAAIYRWVQDSDAIYSAGDKSDDEHVWELDSYSTACQTALAIRDAKDGPVKVERTLIEEKPPVTPGAKELGRHVDVNLTTQFARFYDDKGSVIWDSYFVSGGWDYEKGIMHETPTGTFYLESKQTNQTLVGADLDGDEKPDYESFVNYWMPFLNNDVGFHDATWRGDFGGDIRSWWGSHGCINLPYTKAEELWNIINIGDKVVVHY